MIQLLNISNNTDWDMKINKNKIIFQTKLNDSEKFDITFNNTDNIYEIIYDLNSF